MTDRMTNLRLRSILRALIVFLIFELVCCKWNDENDGKIKIGNFCDGINFQNKTSTIRNIENFPEISVICLNPKIHKIGERTNPSSRLIAPCLSNYSADKKLIIIQSGGTFICKNPAYVDGAKSTTLSPQHHDSMLKSRQNIVKQKRHAKSLMNKFKKSNR